MIERYQFHERICHWLTGIAYVLPATGLAFLFAVFILAGRHARRRYPLRDSGIRSSAWCSSPRNYGCIAFGAMTSTCPVGQEVAR